MAILGKKKNIYNFLTDARLDDRSKKKTFFLSELKNFAFLLLPQQGLCSVTPQKHNTTI